MHSLKVLARARRSLHKLGSSPHQRSLSAQAHYASHDDVQDQVLVDGRASSRTAILNRPSVLNSLTASMVARLKRLYESWEENPNVGLVSMKGFGDRGVEGATKRSPLRTPRGSLHACLPSLHGTRGLSHIRTWHGRRGKNQHN